MSASGPSGPLVIYSHKLDNTFALFSVGQLMDKRKHSCWTFILLTITLVTKNQPTY